jgi:hypothetical protein
VAALLSLVVAVLVAAVVAANSLGWPAARYLPLFPLVILTGMVERFWTLEAEDGTAASFRTLLVTLLIALAVALGLGPRAVVTALFRFPEALGVVLALQLLLGRYTGYRLVELVRFRDFLREPQGAPCSG